MSHAVITPPSVPLIGIPRLPGDKSISHRRALFSLFVSENVVLTNYNNGADCDATLRCLERLGKQIERDGDDWVIRGSMECRSGELDCRNSGTTVRLLMGILAAREGEWLLYGDASLSRRPMERVAEPLRRMGADIATTSGKLPVRIRGRRLHGVDYESPLPSAQVKSAVLLAAMQAEGTTRYREPVPSRDHTERILRRLRRSDGWISLDPRKTDITAANLSGTIPGDPSAAAFWISAVLLLPGSSVVLKQVLINPARIAFIEQLRRVGADIEFENLRSDCHEEIASIRMEHSAIEPLHIAEADAAGLIDELPALSVVAATASGISEFHGIAELRVKESDRLSLIAEGLKRMDCRITLRNDGFVISGGKPLRGAEIETQGDHRIVMAFTIAGLAAQGKTTIHDVHGVDVSYPEFWLELQRLLPDCAEVQD